MPSRRFDAVLYAPWAGTRLTRSSEVQAGGSETQLLLIGRGLVERGLRVGVVMADTPGGLPKSADGMSVLGRRIVQGGGSHLGRAVHAASAAAALAGVSAEVVVQSNAGPTTGLAAAAAKARRARFVYRSASTVDFDFGRLERRAVNLWLFEWGVRAADAVVVQSEEQAVMCRERFGRDPVVIANIAEPVGVRQAEPEAFLWIGRLVGYKRPEVFVELARAVPEARFQMIAVAPAEADPGLAALLDEARATLPNLEVLEPRPREQLMELVERSVAIVNTSDYEGMPNVLLEGFSRGVPALVFRHDPDGIVARHDLGGYADNDSAALADHARRMWAGRHDQQQLAARCLAYLHDHHDAETILDHWINVLRLTESG